MAPARSRFAGAAAAAAACAFVAAALQGCGGDKPVPGPDTTQTTTTVTTTQLGPVPPQPELPLFPLRGMTYQASPGKSMQAPLPGLDMMQVGYAMQWGEKGRDDLGMMRTLGANSVRLYHSAGLEDQTNHKDFLDRAHELGMHVLLGFHTQNICPKFDCFSHWKSAAAGGFGQGWIKDGAWHPAIKVIVLMDEPDNLNLMDKDSSPLNCTAMGDNEAQCRTRAVLSGMDGFLAAEKAHGLDGSNISLTAAWSFQTRDSIDGQLTDSYIFGFQDMVAGIADASIANYKPRNEDAMQSAFDSRWLHSVNVPSEWTFAKEKIADVYGPFKSHSWFIAQLTPTADGRQHLDQDLKDIEAEAKKESSKFLGVAFNTFQVDYQTGTPSEFGIFALGDTELGKVNPCQEDVRTGSKICGEYPVYCLDAVSGSHADEVAAAWGGSTNAHGRCLAPSEDFLAEEEEVPSLVV